MREKEEKNNGIMAHVRALASLPLSNGTHWVAGALFLVLAFLFLGVYNGDLLFREQALSLWLGNPIFAGETLWQSAGGLIYVSRFLGQLSFYPALGALVLSLLLLGIERLTARLCKADTVGQMLLCFVAPAAVLVAQTVSGYSIYDRLDNAFPFEMEAGLLVALLLAWLFGKVGKGNTTAGMAAVFVAAMVLHPFVGVFAYVGVWIYSACICDKDWKNALVLAVSSFAVMLVESSITGRYVFHEDMIVVALAPLPLPYFARTMWWAVFSIVALLAVTAICARLGKDGKEETKNMQPAGAIERATALGSVAVLLACAFGCSNRDANFHTLLKMQRQVDNLDWEGVLETSRRVERPTRAIAACRYIALECTGRQFDEMFDFPVRYEHLDAQTKIFERFFVTPTLFFYSSLLNPALRWSMETWTDVNENFSSLQLMTLYALVRDEPELAKKHVRTLEQSLSYRRWAQHFAQYIGNRDKLFGDYPVFKMVHDMQPQINMSYPGVDYTLPQFMDSYPMLDQANKERRMLLYLYIQRPNLFMKDYAAMGDYYRTHPLPDYFQEVLVDYGIRNNVRVNVKPEVEARVRQFLMEKDLQAGSREQAAKALEKYKGMCLYHLYFGNPNKEEKQK